MLWHVQQTPGLLPVHFPLRSGLSHAVTTGADSSVGPRTTRSFSLLPGSLRVSAGQPLESVFRFGCATDQLGLLKRDGLSEQLITGKKPVKEPLVMGLNSLVTDTHVVLISEMTCS